MRSTMNKYLEKFVNDNYEKPGKALDLGAGDFGDVNGLKQRGWDCEGVDLNTGIDLEESFHSKKGPFDLVYSNYTIQKIKNKKQFVMNIFDNLKPNGYLFLHTFDKSNENGDSKLDRDAMIELLADNFTDIKTRVIESFDNEAGHKHWHKILEVTAQKK